MKKRYIVTGALFLFTLTLTFVFFSMKSKGEDYAAREFGEDYARVALYYPESDKLSCDGINTLRFSIDKALSEDSHSSSGRLWYDSFISFGKARVEHYEQSRSFNSALLVVGGDFFSLHDLNFLEGTPFYSDDNYSDRVVIDEECSFRLYGSNNSVGMPLIVDGREYYVAGVFKRPEGYGWEAQFGVDPVVIIPDRREDGRLYSVYEIVLPDPVDSYAENLVKTAAGETPLSVDVTDRYSLSNLFENLANLKTRSHVARPVAFPWFENEARERQDALSLVLLSTCAGAALFTFSLVYVVIRRKK